jgi:glycine/D-amino acid oxidase-like deaminating enzyme
LSAGRPRVAVLGAGITGCSLAIFLARQGARVSLFEAAPRPLSAASRWNEGKIHLGHLYSGDPGGRTARHVLPGGLAFRPLVEALIDGSLAPAITADDDVYLCHRQSVVAPDAMQAYFEQVTALAASHPQASRYLADLRGAAARRLGAKELAAIADVPEVVAGFVVPERSVRTHWVADRLEQALRAQSGVEMLAPVRVHGATPCGDSIEGAWGVDTSAGRFAPFDWVVNALWEGRLAVDRIAGVPPPAVWSHRYRQSLFVRTREPVQAPCVVVATGPFGDVKNYDGRHFYLSWYPEGLRIESSALVPPQPDASSAPDPQALAARILDRLQSLLPWVADIRGRIEEASIGGGWVFAAGHGQLSDPGSSLHRRSAYGVLRRGRYLSVDTGKYSTAPWTARELAQALV